MKNSQDIVRKSSNRRKWSILDTKDSVMLTNQLFSSLQVVWRGDYSWARLRRMPLCLSLDFDSTITKKNWRKFFCMSWPRGQKPKIYTKKGKGTELSQHHQNQQARSQINDNDVESLVIQAIASFRGLIENFSWVDLKVRNQKFTQKKERELSSHNTTKIGKQEFRRVLMIKK
jgi:hypothetical protein